uniref:receptor like protein kinase S.2-like isoform X2 n=1 Tax=Erigeron canadensis TaxID=72917 RepID=UPI001CB9A4CF|nr:receptor like protein kinase S.2-like isoform X2 [Erigeron canadensis]
MTCSTFLVMNTFTYLNLSTSMILVMILVNIIVYVMRQLHETSRPLVKKKSSAKKPKSQKHICHEFSFSEMQLATNDFDESMIIGKGGFGKVYKGVLQDGVSTQVVAIKRLDSISKQGATEFWTEIKMLSKCRHSNLVSLIGYCNEFNEMMVVYEYISNGDLAERLYKGSSKKSPLSWMERLKICIGAARALDYLHTGTGVRFRIIHRDVKTSNILLDENMAAKLSDLGVSKMGPVDQTYTHVSTDVKGSFGYFDPNYFLTRRLTRKSDVYSFGVVLLEVLCGRPALDPNLGDNELGLVGWAQQFIKESTVHHIIDPYLMTLTHCSRVRGQIMPDCLKAFVELADKCLQTRPKERPTMSEVVVALETAVQLQQRGDYVVMCSGYDHQDQANSNSGRKSRNITLSRMLRNLLPVKSSLTPDSLEKKKSDKRFVPGTFSNTEVLPSEGDTYQEFDVSDSSLKLFSLDELKHATRNFSDDMVVGEGAFGKVFEGWVEEETYAPSKVGYGIPVAVKKLDPDSMQGVEEWQSEVKFLSKLGHPNIVKLLGYCSEDKDLLLVYEFLHGSLENYVLKSNIFPTNAEGFGLTLSWSMRVKIMMGTAQGIAFLHSKENQIIFRDLKASNILLDKDFNAKIADFGLARHGPINGETQVCTQVMGTYGYAAPEYVATGHLNGKNDIYAFGVVLLETLTGLHVLDKTRPVKEQNLVEWMRPMLSNKEKVKTIVDSSLYQDYPPEAAYRYAQLILKCTQAEPKDRPSIEQVLQSLDQISGIKKKLFKRRG